MSAGDRPLVMAVYVGLLAGCGPRPAVEGPNVKISRAALDAAVAARVLAAGLSNAVAVSAEVVRREVVRELVVGERLRAKASELGAIRVTSFDLSKWRLSVSGVLGETALGRI